ncbi:MAG: hypothetical protein MUE85_10165 [Microscillaceae bacterium]|jgi:hypothetical protein|nr:hypothetical protein [Microscillaceae bacterium]
MEKIIRRVKFGEESKPYIYWLTKTPQERIEALELIREQIIWLKPELKKYASEFQKVYRVAQR